MVEGEVEKSKLNKSVNCNGLFTLTSPVKRHKIKAMKIEIVARAHEKRKIY